MLAVIAGYAELLEVRDDDATRLAAARGLAEAVARLRALHAEVLDALQA